jgi:hypothetical protein
MGVVRGVSLDNISCSIQRSNILPVDSPRVHQMLLFFLFAMRAICASNPCLKLVTMVAFFKATCLLRSLLFFSCQISEQVKGLISSRAARCLWDTVVALWCRWGGEKSDS